MHAQLFTIGHSVHPQEYFLELLRLHRITAVCDVRSQPYSRFNPQFNQSALAQALRERGIAYGFLGRELGARSDNPDCYVDGKAVHARIAATPEFRKGLEKLRKRMQEHRVALMCAEKDPITCHRTILVCRQLRSPELQIHHILETGELESAPEAELRLLALLGLPRTDLFTSEEEMIERAYDLQSGKIAYTTDAAAEGADGAHDRPV